MIHTVDPAMTVIVGRACPYCGKAFASGDQIVEDNYPVRHEGCGPAEGTPWEARAR